MHSLIFNHWQQISFHSLKAILENNPDFALRLCNRAHIHIKHRAELYSTLGDAYIALKRFSLTESSYLLSISFGSVNFKNYFNLASLYLMKKDFPCAEHYLSLASSIDPLILKFNGFANQLLVQ